MTTTQSCPIGTTDSRDAVAAGAVDGGGRQIRPHRGLPGGRAVVGGLLVAVAAVGTFAAASGAGRTPGTEVVVAARDIAPGTVLGAGDVELVPVDLPPSLGARVFTSAEPVLGAVAVGPLAAGELVQVGGLAPATEAAVPTFALSLPTAAANGGRLQRGDRVQVLATYGADASAVTRLLAGQARVVDVDRGGSDLGASGQVQVILAIASAQERTAVINAVTSGTITLVRTTGAGNVEAPAPHRPDAPDPTEAGAPGSTAPGSGERGEG